MDPMDIDHTVDVPDTPDRLAARGPNVRSGIREENHRSSRPPHSRQQKLSVEGSKDQPLIIDSGNRKLSLNRPKCAVRSSSSLQPVNSAAISLVSPSSSSRNGSIFRKGLTGMNTSCKSHDPIHTQHQHRPSFVSESSSQGDSFIARAEKYLQVPLSINGFPGGMPGKNRAELRTNVSTAGEGAGNVNGVGSSSQHGQGVELASNILNKPIASPRVNRHKRLVRNGCISPINIAKGKQLAGTEINGSVNATRANSGSNASSDPPVSLSIRELVAEENNSHRGKGKGVISHACSSRETDLRNKNFRSRSSINSSEEAMGTSEHARDTGKSIGDVSGWRSTHKQARYVHLLPDEDCFLISDTDTPRSSSQHHENRVERREKCCAAIGDDFPKDQNLISPDPLHTRPVRKTVIQPGTRFGQLNGPRPAANTHIKRQKHGSTPTCFNECSTSVSDDPEIEFLGSYAETSDRPSSSSAGNLQPVIEVNEISPQLRQIAHDEDVRARQVEADALLARELQEQLYSEGPAFRDIEIDAHLALDLQNQDFAYNGTSRATRPASHARGSLTSNIHRQSESRPSSSAPRGRGAQPRTSTSARMTRLRSRFPGQSRTIMPSRGRTPVFPANMDVDMRMHILGALEAFNDLGVGPGAGILHTNRDFNEDDYEMLLALDENNVHGGASVHQINSLPQSTLQTDNFEGACAICLDAPSIGDAIRHLPCLHKFHKDCIDPWLRRKTSCPVCKSSIT